MLKLVKPAKRSVRPIRRAVFVVDHPDLGRSVICRNVFRRKIFGREFSARDECRGKGSLQETAQDAMSVVFKGAQVRLERRGMFSMHGMRTRPVESTVFVVEMLFEPVYRLLSTDQYILLTEHPLRGHVLPLLQEPELKPRLRGIG